jgi:hypothetical protein
VSTQRRPAGGFVRHVASVRNRIVFHYDPSLVSRAVRRRAARKVSSLSQITRGSHSSLWRSGLADDVEDTIVCRLLWQIPDGTDVTAEADKILAFGEQICRDFLDLAGELSFKYLRRTATV